jgi:hypothetical protein
MSSLRTRYRHAIFQALTSLFLAPASLPSLNSQSPGNGRGLLLWPAPHRRNHQLIEFGREVRVFRFTRVPSDPPESRVQGIISLRAAGGNRFAVKPKNRVNLASSPWPIGDFRLPKTPEWPMLPLDASCGT